MFTLALAASFLINHGSNGHYHYPILLQCILSASNKQRVTIIGPIPSSTILFTCFSWPQGVTNPLQLGPFLIFFRLPHDFFPARDLANIDRQLYGKHAKDLMKCDVHENENDYKMDMDLPGFKKDQNNIDLENGYLTISASKEHDSEKKKHGNKEPLTFSFQSSKNAQNSFQLYTTEYN